MNVANDMSIVSLITGASVPVQIVMLILVLTSLISWWYIFIKFFTLRAAEKNAEEFESAFWAGGDLNKLYDGIGSGRKKPQGMASIFESGFKEFIRHKQKGGEIDVSDVMEGSRRAMQASYNREIDHLDSHLPFLASVGSVSPYIGLLGTVWGIMNAFIGLANVAQATLSQVAPGIAEALIATAIFMEEFTNILQRRA